MANNKQRPKLGAVFGDVDRTQGLSGLMSPARRAPQQPAAAPPARPAPKPAAGPDVPASVKPAPAPPRPGPATAQPAETPAAAQQPANSEKSPKVQVSVLLDMDVLVGLRAFAKRTSTTLGAVVLQAIETNVNVLSTRWCQPEPGPAGRLFTSTLTVQRRSSPGTSAAFRIEQNDVAVIDRLVAEWSAPSRSALVNEALSVHLAGEAR